MTKENRKMLTGCMIIGAALIAWSFFMGGTENKNSKNSSVVIATINKLQIINGSDNIDVQYNYQGKAVNKHFNIPNNDSLKQGAKVKLLVSGNQPGKLIKYIGISK